MTGDVEVEDPAASVVDDEETVQELEGHGGHREEVERGDHLTVIPQEGKPPPGRVATATNVAQAAGHGSFGDDEAELLQFAVDPGGSPIEVLCRHAPDERAHLLAGARPTAPRPGPPAPVETEAGAVPADDGLGFHDDQDLAPPAPATSKSRPEETVEGVHDGPWPFAFEDSDLLAEREDLKGHIASTAEKAADDGQ